MLLVAQLPNPHGRDRRTVFTFRPLRVYSPAPMAEAEDPGPLVVNVAHLMAYVDEQRAAGNTAFKRKQYPAALAAWQRALDACEQADGKPMLVADVETVLRARSVLHSNRGQALIEQEWWRRAVKELSEVRSAPAPAAPPPYSNNYYC